MKSIINGVLTLSIALFLDHYAIKAQSIYTVHACKDGRIRLNCRIGIISVTDIFLADSKCSGSSCCPRANDCKGPPSEQYRSSVLFNCNEKSSCLVAVEIREIGCSTWGPRNDYVNISYTCLAPTSTTKTTTTSTITTAPSTPASSSSLISAPSPVVIVINHAPSTKDDSYQTGERDTTRASFSRGSSERSSTLHGTEKKEKEEDSDPEHGKSDAQNDIRNEDYTYLDKITVMVGLIVGGVVITVTVVSAAVVMALKKRRIVKEDESYDIPDIPCSADGGDESNNCRSSNFYDVIPDFRDSGHCSVDHSGEEFVKEDEYLKPVIDDEERPYVWVP